MEVLLTLDVNIVSLVLWWQVLVQRKEADEKKLRKLMMEHKPHVVVVAASNLACRKLKDAIFEVSLRSQQDAGYGLRHLWRKHPVVLSAWQTFHHTGTVVCICCR